MPLNVPTFFKRLGSSVVFVAVMLTGLLWNEWSFLGLVCLINFLCLREYMRLMQKVDKEAYWPGWIPAALQVGAFFAIILVFAGIYGSSFLFLSNNAAEVLELLALIFPPLLLLIATLPTPTAWKAAAQSLFGIAYIVAPMALLLVLRSYHHLLPLFILLLIWTNDTGAYLVGSFIGKTPFSPISPKKTWEGIIGGTLLTIGVAVLIGSFKNSISGSEPMPVIFFGLPGFALCGLLVSLFGPAGDLFKSKFKRIADVKDSGNLMPGHGGALDRFDSLLMVVPFIYCLMKLAALNEIWHTVIK